MQTVEFAGWYTVARKGRVTRHFLPLEIRMKIVAITDDGFLVSADKNEIAQLIGYHEAYYHKDRWDREIQMQIGFEFHTAAMFNQLRDLRNHADEVEKMRSSLIALANLLELPKSIAEIKVGPDAQ